MTHTHLRDSFIHSDDLKDHKIHLSNTLNKLKDKDDKINLLQNKNNQLMKQHEGVNSSPINGSS